MEVDHDGMPGMNEPATWLVRSVRGAERIVALLCGVAVTVAALLLAAIFVLISYSVGMRYFAGVPLPWIDEAAGWLLAGSVMLAVPEVQRRGDHIGIDFLARKMTPRGLRLLAMFGLAMVLASAVVFAREGFEMVAFSRMLNVLSNQIPEVPLWMVQGVVPVGFSLMILVALMQLVCLIVGLMPRGMNLIPAEDV
jgi:TRAP-type C4-dicarboxylate transport system permease small subunit